jgi:hypothetical protein
MQIFHLGKSNHFLNYSKNWQSLHKTNNEECVRGGGGGMVAILMILLCPIVLI